LLFYVKGHKFNLLLYLTNYQKNYLFYLSRETKVDYDSPELCTLQSTHSFYHATIFLSKVTNVFILKQNKFFLFKIYLLFIY